MSADREVVHILRAGKTLCPFWARHRLPGDWPEGHRWVSIKEGAAVVEENVTCTGCRLIWNRENAGR